MIVAREQEWAFTKEFKVAFIPKKTSIGSMVTNIMLKNMLPCGRPVCATLAPKKKTEICLFHAICFKQKNNSTIWLKIPKTKYCKWSIWRKAKNEYRISLLVSPSQLWAETLKVRDLPTDSSCLKNKIKTSEFSNCVWILDPWPEAKSRFLWKISPISVSNTEKSLGF